jgi:chaperonin GroES
MEEQTQFEPYFDAVIIKPVEEQETQYGSIIVPDMGKDKNVHGTVIAIGPGVHTVTGEFIPTAVKIGDRVILPTQGFTKFEHEGEEYWVGCEKQILTKVIKS